MCVLDKGVGLGRLSAVQRGRRSDGKRRRRKTNKTRQRHSFYTFFLTTLPTSGARGEIEDDESIRSPPPLAPLEAEGRERDGHGDDDGINHTRLDRRLRGRREGGDHPLSCRGDTPTGRADAHGRWVIPGAIDQTNKTRIGLEDQIQFRLIRLKGTERGGMHMPRGNYHGLVGIGRQKTGGGEQGAGRDVGC